MLCLLCRIRSPADELLVAEANSPLQYPTQGIQVRPLKTILIPGNPIIASSSKKNNVVSVQYRQSVPSVLSPTRLPPGLGLKVENSKDNRVIFSRLIVGDLCTNRSVLKCRMFPLNRCI